MNIFVLGGKGFIGMNIFQILSEKGYKVYSLCRNDFDMSEPDTYKVERFKDSIIIDCIVKIDSNLNNIIEINYESLKYFINKLNEYKINYKYIYFSTASVVNTELIRRNIYIKSKALAEEFIIKNVDKYLIIRLSFPFGCGESNQRLISRLIDKVKNDENITIKNTTLKLTPINILKINFLDLINFQNEVIVFINQEIFNLKEVVEYIIKKLNKKNFYCFDNTVIEDLTFVGNYTFNSKKEVYQEIDRMIDEVR